MFVINHMLFLVAIQQHQKHLKHWLQREKKLSTDVIVFPTSIYEGRETGSWIAVSSYLHFISATASVQKVRVYALLVVGAYIYTDKTGEFWSFLYVSVNCVVC